MQVVVSGQGLTKSYSHRALFAELNIDLRAGEKIGLIGPNGAGKSTLMKILADLEVPDDGAVSLRKGMTLGFVAQDDSFDSGLSVHDVVKSGTLDLPLDDYERDTEATIALTQVGFDNHDLPADTLSGGWRKRLSLAREFVRRPDFLLLDEPTNHLDLPGVLWLEKTLRQANFGYLVATHDRAFLRGVADEIVEVSRVYPDGIFRTPGNWDTFEEKRAVFLDGQARQRDAVANKVRQETEWLGRSESAQRSKSKSRIGEAAVRREQLAELNQRTNTGDKANIDFVATGRQTKKLLDAQGISKSLGGKPLFSNVDILLSPGMCLGLLGPNGGGKTTLLKILSGQMEPDTGTIKRAEALRVEVFEQGRSSLDLKLPLRQALSPNGENVMYNGAPMHVAAWAKRFMFDAKQLDIELSALSGGEQARVRLAQLMLRPADLLFLDEPTNDLDIPSLEVLENTLSEFPGAVVLVTHDRELMDRLCTEVIGLDGLGGAAPYGSVQQWLTAYTQAQEKPTTSKKKATTPTAPAAKTKKMSYKEQKELDGMEEAILKAEQAVSTHEHEVNEAANAGHEALTAACQRMEGAQSKVEQLYKRWAELEEKAKG